MYKRQVIGLVVFIILSGGIQRIAKVTERVCLLYTSARQAAERAISSPLLETSISGAMGVIINITSSPDIGLEEITIASEMIADMVHPDANIIWGTAFDESMEDEMSVTVIATGFSPEARALSAAAKAAETEKKQNDDLDLPLFGQANTTAPATRVDNQRKRCV